LSYDNSGIHSGFYNGGAGLEVRPGDMIKLGLFVVGKGEYQGQVVVSEAWIDKMTMEHMVVSPTQRYGYQCWITPEIPDRNVMALGYRGQFIIVFPDLKAVVVATSNWRGSNATNTTQGEFFKLLSKDIYPFIKG